MKKTSLNDIAVRLGVSKTLVSLVLNGKGKQHRISDEVCEKVLAAAKEMNYQPNHIARGLRTGKTNTIGLIIADIANPFFGKLGREIEKEAAEHGYRVMFCSSDENAENFVRQIEMLAQGQVDGLIVSPPAGSLKQIKSLEKNKIPYVLIDRYFPEIESNTVVIDNFNAAYKAVNHLISQGYNKIGCISINNSLVNMHLRVEGYKQALEDDGIEVRKDMIKILPFSHERYDFDKALKELVLDNGNKADSVFFTTSKAGIMGLEYIYSRGLKIPEDVAVVSFDDPDAYRISNPPVTAVAQPLKEMGSRAVNILIDMIENDKEKNKKEKIVLNAELIIRNSSIRAFF